MYPGFLSTVLEAVMSFSAWQTDHVQSARGYVAKVGKKLYIDVVTKSSAQ